MDPMLLVLFFEVFPITLYTDQKNRESIPKT